MSLAAGMAWSLPRGSLEFAGLCRLARADAGALFENGFHINLIRKSGPSDKAAPPAQPTNTTSKIIIG
jgi:hypothetical protein